MTDAASGSTAAEWAAAMLDTLPRLTDEQWNRVNATLGITTTPAPPADKQPDRPTAAAA